LRVVSIFLVVAVLAMAPNLAFGEHVIDSKENPEYLFVLSSESGSYEGDTLTLNDVPSVIYFSDRPERIAGHMSLKEFVEKWGQGPNSFKADPPNATLSILDESGNKDVVVELMNPGMKENRLQFKVRLLKGELPATFKACSLFTDAEDSNTLPLRL